MNPNAQTLPKSVLDGVLIVGTDRGCAKTVVTAGLAAAIGAAGFHVQALKPLAFCPDLSLNRNQDQAFLNKITQQYIQAETINAASPWEVSVPLWNKMLEQCKTLQYPCLLESPGQVASPWRITGHTIVDAPDVAKQLGLSVLLVAKAEETFFEKTRAALSFIQARGVESIGFVRVYTAPGDEQPEDSLSEVLLLTQHFGVPFLGELPYSPSISVSTLHQGNLLRLTQENIDLLPIQLGIGLKL